ncbi:GCN5-related N-acetyltransferase [Vibrio antiquarius]|uniref:GCN5-related N-acetyltransferase n=1 Tax=Vibrio antiquarius (strain Ex25) TaxID=150340 RepID=A0ACA6QQZ2_VIBAE|nr:GNAT family N-acetyltransferase [Vibrio antiquarius]ACY52828.1 GCN5-related N-acetyltransferase [Vibrio antiquarius]
MAQSDDRNTDNNTTGDLHDLTAVVLDSNVEVTGYKQFDCGNEIINRYVKKSLKAQAKAPGNGVVVLLNNENQIVGFFTLTLHSLTRDKLNSVSDFVGKTAMVPAVRLTMIGVDIKYQGNGIGSDLMALVFEKTHAIASSAGCSGLYLDADHYAVDFYRQLGFTALDTPDPITLVVPMFLHLSAIPK